MHGPYLSVVVTLFKLPDGPVTKREREREKEKDRGKEERRERAHAKERQ